MRSSSGDRRRRAGRPEARPEQEHAERNALLAALPPRDYAWLGSQSERVSLRAGQILHGPGHLVSHIYFPQDCVLSLVLVDPDHPDGGGERPVEVAMVGREGLVGFDALRGIATVLTRCLVQVPGTATCVSVDLLVEEIEAREPVRRLLARYAQALFDQAVVSLACGRLHSPEQRMARWLLMAHDRLDGDEIALTQAMLAATLGTARQTVSAVSQDFAARRLIAARRARVRITDRPGLEALSCGCYRLVSDRFHALLAGETSEA